MAIRYRAAQNLDPNAAPLTDIRSSEPTLLPDIPAPGNARNGESAITVTRPSGDEILTAVAPLITSLPTQISTTPTIPRARHRARPPLRQHPHRPHLMD